MTSPNTTSPEQYLDTTLEALKDPRRFGETLNALPVPIYVTDAKGAVTYWNQACIAFAGRVPQLGEDRWCVTWQLYSTCGEPIRHDQCPMAQAIKERRPIRDAIAIAERPNGTRVAFRPYPTPLFGADGALTGAVNMLVDVSAEQGPALAEQAARCRRLAVATHDRTASFILGRMAEGYEDTAAALGASADAEAA